ncbi:hypothetical protein TGMAS_252990 [Toxoplasma gondii MAS]|uniref:Uncharacterized protein n=2 Tax=Toxoplasma gondii TaxID=5811 RepID=A0A086PNH6_TOXGO|nr:hypothetical protein TGMAS_252990 [Toxoplasma gondii MAS]PUA89143.1 hypothetical protein TGBR9_252990 [Toxoplasma gondii TgCATBr9]
MEASIVSDPGVSETASPAPGSLLSLPGGRLPSASLPSPRHRPVLPASPARAASPSSVLVYDAATGLLQRCPGRTRGASVPSLSRRRDSDSRLHTSRGVSVSMVAPDAQKVSRVVSAAPSAVNSPRRRATDDIAGGRYPTLAEDGTKYRLTVAGHPIHPVQGVESVASPPLPPSDLLASPAPLLSGSPSRLASTESMSSPLGHPGCFPVMKGQRPLEKAQGVGGDGFLRDAPRFPPPLLQPSQRYSLPQQENGSTFACPYCRRTIPLPVLQHYVSSHPQMCCPGRTKATPSQALGGRREESFPPFPPGGPNRATRPSPTCLWRTGSPNDLIEAFKRRQGKVWGPVPPSFFTSPYNTQYWFFV